MDDQYVPIDISGVVPPFERDVTADYPQIDDSVVTEVSQILSSNGDDDGSRRPRTYILLHYLRLTHYHPAFSGFSDDYLPYMDWTLPKTLRDENARRDFMKWQYLFVPQKNKLFGPNVKPHMNFTDEHSCQLLHVKVLGHGAWGVVECVKGKISGRVFARKKFFFKGRTSNIMRIRDSFERELQALKRLHHHHLITYFGSYTDPRGTSLIMLPVAECDMSIWMQKNSDTTAIRRFFGCLASALAFLHQEKVRHKDIKPSNILVYRKDRVLLSDFGSSLDWREWENSSTSGNAEMGTRIYAPPESFDHERRGSSSDIFSLGCVFLELATALCGRLYDDLHRHLNENGTCVVFYGDNKEGVISWIDELKKLQLSATELKLLDIILRTLETNRMERPTASKLTEDIIGLGEEFCCNDCHVDRVMRDLEGFDINVQEPEKRGRVLCIIAQRGETTLFELLLSTTDDVQVEVVADITLKNAIKFDNLTIAESHLSHCQRRGIGLRVHDALSYAVRKGNKDAVELLLRFGADANATQGTQATQRSPLYLAASWGHDQIIQTMIFHGVDLYRREHLDGKTVLHAIFRGIFDAEALGLILAQKLDVNAADAEGTTPLMEAINSRGTVPESLNLLLKAGADPNKPDKLGQTPLLHACKNKKPWRVELAKVLIKWGADVHHAAGPSRNTPLHVAAAHGNTEMVLFLLRNGAHVEARNSSNETPFQRAASRRDLHLLTHLLGRGASTKTKGDHQSTELISAASCDRAVNGSGWTQIAGPTVLKRALAHSDPTAANILLACGVGIIEENNEKESEMFKAMLEKQTEAANPLIHTGCELEEESGQSTIILLMAAFLNCTALAKELIDHGAPLEVRDKFGSTALSVAACKGNTELVRLLLDAGANIENKDRHGWTPLFLAANEGEIDTAKLLVDNGAKILEIYQNAQLSPCDFSSACRVLEEMKEYSMSTNSSFIAWVT